jgi:DNA-directed RNA polymerase specialized sigma24 family protein
MSSSRFDLACSSDPSTSREGALTLELAVAILRDAGVPACDRERILEGLMTIRFSSLRSRSIAERSIPEFVKWVALGVSRRRPWIGADDLCQESLLRFVGSVVRLNDPAALPGFLRAIVWNTAMRWPQGEIPAETHADSIGAESGRHDGAEDGNGDRRHALLRAYHRAWKMLPTAPRRCYLLRKVRHLSRAQAAAALGVSPSSVPVYEMRARRLLAAGLAGPARSLGYRVPAELPAR